MKFGEVLSKAGRIIWQNKVLCIPQIIFLLISLVGSQFLDLYNRSDGQMVNLFSLTPLSAACFFCTGSIFLLPLMLYLSVVGPMVVIRGTAQADQGLKVDTFKGLVESVRSYFWKMVVLYLIYILIGWVVYYLALWINWFVSDLSGGVSNLNLSPLIFLIAILLIPFSALFSLAKNTLILKNTRIFKALSQGSQLLARTFAITIKAAFLLYFINLIINYLVKIPERSILSNLVNVLIENPPNVPSAWLMIFTTLAYFLVRGIVVGVVSTYVYSIWTLVYLRLTASAQDPAIAESVPV